MTKKANPFAGPPSEGPATGTPQRDADLGDLLAASSFGSEQARAIRAQTPKVAREHARRIVDEVSPSSMQRGGESGDPDAAGTIERVVLIDGCSGVQYGRGNEQYSVYRVTLPPVALESADALARHLLSGDRQWSRDVFDHNGHASFAGLADGGSAFSGAAEAVAGDTLVIIRNSRGVQVGDGNTQHNEFQIRVAKVAIRAVQAGPAAASRAAVDQLRQHPSQATAETVARQIADAARDHLVLDLTAQVTRDVGSPIIPGQPAQISRRTGVQAGGSDRAHVQVVVEVTTVKVNRLTADLLRQARRDLAAKERAAEERAPTFTTPSREAGRAEPSPADLLAKKLASIDRNTKPPSTDAGEARGGISTLG